MVTVPGLLPVKTPVELTVAEPVPLVTDHPAPVGVSSIDCSRHISAGTVRFGKSYMVTESVILLHPFASVNVKVANPGETDVITPAELMVANKGSLCV